MAFLLGTRLWHSKIAKWQSQNQRIFSKKLLQVLKEQLKCQVCGNGAQAEKVSWYMCLDEYLHCQSCFDRLSNSKWKLKKKIGKVISSDEHWYDSIFENYNSFVCFIMDFEVFKTQFINDKKIKYSIWRSVKGLKAVRHAYLTKP